MPAPVGLVLAGKEAQPRPSLCHQPSGEFVVESEERRKSRRRPAPRNLSPGHHLWHPRQGGPAGQGMNCSLPLPLLCTKPLNPCPKGSQGAPARQGASNNAPLVLAGFSERCSNLGLSSKLPGEKEPPSGVRMISYSWWWMKLK